MELINIDFFSTCYKIGQGHQKGDLRHKNSSEKELLLIRAVKTSPMGKIKIMRKNSKIKSRMAKLVYHDCICLDD
jgi:hypothetical protein